MIKYNFGGGHLGFQDGRHAKCILLYSSPTGQNRHMGEIFDKCAIAENPFTSCLLLII